MTTFIDYVGPVAFHNPGFPPELVPFIKSLNPMSPPRIILLAEASYKEFCKRLDDAMNHRFDKLEKPKVLGEVISHLTIDCFMLYMALTQAKVVTGEFPFHELLVKIYPEKQEIST